MHSSDLASTEPNRQFGINDKEVLQSVPATGGGQFDDAEDCENGNRTSKAPLQSEPPRAVTVSHAFSIAPQPVLVVDGPVSQFSKPMQERAANSIVPSTAHPLDYLVEAACASKTRTPKRVSLSPTNHGDLHRSQEMPRGSGPALAATARTVSDLGHESPDDAAHEQHVAQPSLTDSKTPRKSFEERYSELQFFKKRFGHCDVLTNGDYKGLGRWLSTLRCRFRNGEVSHDQAAFLRDLGCIGFGDDEPKLNPDATVYKGNSYPMDAPPYGAAYGGSGGPTPHAGGYHHYQPPPPPPPHYQHQHNHPPPKASYHHQSRIPFADLGGVSNHPIRKLTGPPPPHSIHRMPAASSSFVPNHYTAAQSPREADHAAWSYWLDQLGAFRAKYHHTNVTTVNVRTNQYQGLTLWLASQRNLHRKGQLIRERAIILHNQFDCPGFEPGAAPMDLDFVPEDALAGGQQQHQPFEAIQQQRSGPQYQQRNVTSTPNMHLCDVLHAQRIYRDQCKEKGETIASKPGRKRGQYVGWHERLNQLNEFRKKYNHVDIRIMMHDENKDLGRWLASQRHQFRKGKLPQDKAEILQNLGVTLALKKPQCYRTGPNAPQFFAAAQAGESSASSA